MSVDTGFEPLARKIDPTEVNELRMAAIQAVEVYLGKILSANAVLGELNALYQDKETLPHLSTTPMVAAAIVGLEQVMDDHAETVPYLVDALNASMPPQA